MSYPRALRDTPAVAGDRTRELWRDRETSETFLVEVEDDRVLAVTGPVAPEDLDRERRAFEQAAAGRSPAFTAAAADLEARRAAFDREPLTPPK